MPHNSEGGSDDASEGQGGFIGRGDTGMEEGYISGGMVGDAWS